MLPTNSLLKRLPILLLLLMTPAYYLVPWSALGWRGEAMAVAFILAYAVYLPGHVINRAVGRRCDDPLSDLTASTLYGLAFAMLLMFGWTVSGLSLDTWTRLMPVAIAGTVLLGLLRVRELDDNTPRIAAGTLPPMLLTVLLIALAFVVLRAGVPIDFGADTIDHVGYVNEIQETGQPFPTTAFYAEGGTYGKDVRKGFLHQFYGYASAYAGMAPLRFMNTINTVLAILLLLTIYAVTLHWFNDGWVAVAAALIFALGVTGGLSTLLVRVAYYPSRFGVVFFLFMLTSALDYIWHRRKSELPRLAIFAFAACATHVFFAVLIGMFGMVLMVWKNCFAINNARTHYQRVAVIGLWIAIGAVPVTLYRYFTDFPQANDLHTELQGVLLLGPVYIAEPTILFRWLGPLGLAAILCAIPLWHRKGTHPAIGYLIAAGLTIPLALLNPLVLPMLHRFMTYLTFRIVLLFPFYILAAFYLIGYIRERLGRRDGYERVITPGFGSGAVALVVLVALFLQVAPGMRSVASWANAREREASQSYRLWQDGLDFLNTEIPTGSIVVSDPVTGYSIPAFTSSYTVCALDQHVPPNDVLLVNRIRIARDILSPFVPMQRTLELLDESGATYVVLNNRFGSKLLFHYWTMGDEVFTDSVNKFDTFPDLFDRVYDSNDFIVYHRRGSAMTNEAIAPNWWRLGEVPEDYRRIGKMSGVAKLEAARVHAGTLAPGQRVDIDLVWSGDGPYELDNYVVSLRFDHVAPRLPFGGKPFPKLARKFKERTSGRLYRYRSDHKLAAGFLSPDVWARDDLIHDQASVRLPSNLAPGKYSVQAKLHIVPNEPVYTLHDLLYDDDVFMGVEIGRLTIE